MGEEIKEEKTEEKKESKEEIRKRGSFFNSIRYKIMLITALAVIIATVVAAALGINAVRTVGKESSDQMLLMLCEAGEKNLDSHFQSIENSVAIVSSFAETDLIGLDPSEFEKHMERVEAVFGRVAGQTNGVLTYYYRIDPEYTKEVEGFWYINKGRRGFQPHEVTDISGYDTEDTSQLVWYTVPKATGQPIWLPPYITENLDVRVLSYNVPVYKEGKFFGVVGIEIDYSTMASQVNNIRLYENGYAFVNDAQGKIVYHPYIDVTSLSEEEKPTAPEGLLNHNTFVKYTYEGVEKQAVSLPLSNGMILNVAVPISEINQSWKSLVNRIIVIMVILLVAFILFTLQFAGHITKPLRELTKAAEQVNEGNYDVELEYSGDDEVGVLTYTFHKLIANVKTYISDLNTLNKRLQEDNLTLEAATIRDSLTGVKNRFALRRDYTKYEEKDIHIMMLDLDDFKRVNDNFGHSVGDYLLKKTGDMLTENFGAEYSYRYGGDEFLVIIPDISEEDFVKTLDNLGKELKDVYLEDKKLPVHFSAGYVYGKTLLNDDLRLMLRQADELLYKSKSIGKNTFKGDEYNREYALGIKKKEEEAFRHE